MKSPDLNPGPLGNIFIHTAGPQVNEMGNHRAKKKKELMHASYINSSINPYIHMGL